MCGQAGGWSQPHLFKGLKHFRSLAEVLEEQLQSSGQQRRVVMHDEVDEDPEERPAPFIIKLDWGFLLPTKPKVILK